MPAAHEALRAAQLRAASTAFLRLRPLVAGLGALANAALLAASGAPRAQLAPVGLTTAAMIAAFTAESLALRAREVTERWLALSLALTVAWIAFGCALTGGLASPLVPLLFAPVVISFAAFGKDRRADAMLALAALLLALLFALPEALLGRSIARPWATAMTLVSATVSAVLLRIGVGALADAHARAAATLDRLREAVVEEAAARARETEALGAKVAHEIRNPLTSVKGLVQILARKAEDPRDQRRFEVVLEDVARIEETLSGYLSFAKPLADLRPEPVDLALLVDEIATVIEARAEARRVAVSRGGEPTTALADPRRLREALLNLAVNALAAMPDGGRLDLSVARAGDRARLAVRDSGAGMSPETLAQLGTPFFTTREGGTGLGVLLARSVARLHGGELEIESAPGRGTTATLVLPLTLGDTRDGAHPPRG